VEAFEGLVPKGTSLATAVARSANLISKGQAVADYKLQVEKLIACEGTHGVDPDLFVKGELRARNQAVENFLKGTKFGPEDERTSVKKELLHELDTLRIFFESENTRKMEASLTIFSGLALLSAVLYLMDKLSDFTCDWYSETCVRVSNALFLVYFTVTVAILTNVYLVYQSRGQTVAIMAMIEMGKSTISMVGLYIDSVKKILSDWRESRDSDLRADLGQLWTRIRCDIGKGISAVGISFKEAFAGRKSS
jgi:hypothetical protein